MQKKIQYLLNKILRLKGYFITALTDKKLVEDLMKRLYPVCTDKSLIRLGPKSDGGYLVPNDFVGIGACFSPGVSLVSGFEKDCADMGMEVYLADKSVSKPAECHQRFHFTKKFVGVTTNDDFMTIDDWVISAELADQMDLLLQIDIEGFEYEAFLTMSDSLMTRYRIIVAEFHGLDQLWNKPFFDLASRAFEKVLQTHTCVHIHPNNCFSPYALQGLLIPPVAEFTFLRNDRVINPIFANKYPHSLDFDCTSNPHYPLPSCWFKSAY